MEENINHPLVSIITPLFNAEDYIESTIDSVLAQTYPNWEMIIVDDFSTDSSVEIVKRKMQGDKRVKLFLLDKNHGMPYAARNYATKEAKGELIAFLDSDDMWAKNKLARQVDFMIRNSHPISFTAYSKIYENNPLKKKTINIPAVVSFKDLLKTNSLGCLTAMYNVEKVGKLFQVNHLYEDYIMWLQILQKGFKVYGLNEILASYRVHDKGYSNNKLKMARVTWNIYRKIMNINFFKSAWYFFNYTWNGLKKM